VLYGRIIDKSTRGKIKPEAPPCCRYA